MSRQQKAYVLALTAILFWSTAGSAFKLTLQHISPTQLLLGASLFSLVILVAWKVARNELPECFRVTRRQWLNSAILGLLNPFAYYIILFEAYDLLLAQEAVALNYVWPITLVILSIPVLKQRISIWSILALMISFSGMLVIIFKGSWGGVELSSPKGIAFALVSSVFWATYWLMNMKDKREEGSKLVLNFTFGFIYVLIFALASGTEIKFSPEGILGSVYVGFFEMGVTYLLWLKALQISLTTAKVSNLVYISPFLSLMFVSIAVGETIYLYTILGLVLIVGGIILQRMLK